MYGFMIEGFGNTTYIEGASVTADALSMALESRLPPRFTVFKTVNRDRTAVGSQVEITVAVTNTDDSVVEDVKIDDCYTLLGYAYAIDLRSSTTRTIDSLASGATEAITYSVLTGRPGEFRLRPAEVS